MLKEIDIEINSSTIPVIGKIIKFRENQFTSENYGYLSEGEFDSLLSEAINEIDMNFEDFSEGVIEDEIDFDEHLILECLESEWDYINTFFEFHKAKHKADGLAVKVLFDDYSIDEDLVTKAAKELPQLQKKLDRELQKLPCIEKPSKLKTSNYKKVIKATETLGADSWDSGFHGVVTTREQRYIIEAEGFSLFIISTDDVEFLRKFTADDNDEFAEIVSNIFAVESVVINKIELR